LRTVPEVCRSISNLKTGGESNRLGDHIRRENEEMLKIGIVVGSTRPGRKAAAVARWVHDILKSRKDAEFEIVDIEDYKLPLLDEPVSPRMHQYSKPHTKSWSEKIASLDAYIFVTPEYNHATSAALKNAIDFLFHEWNNKAAGFVGYGGAGGVRAVENLRLVMGEIKIADARAQVALRCLPSSRTSRPLSRTNSTTRPCI
jgi:NAD(P)H-dependent FMN reductase